MRRPPVPFVDLSFALLVFGDMTTVLVFAVL